MSQGQTTHAVTYRFQIYSGDRNLCFDRRLQMRVGVHFEYRSRSKRWAVSRIAIGKRGFLHYLDRVDLVYFSNFQLQYQSEQAYARENDWSALCASSYGFYYSCPVLLFFSVLFLARSQTILRSCVFSCLYVRYNSGRSTIYCFTLVP